MSADPLSAIKLLVAGSGDSLPAYTNNGDTLYAREPSRVKKNRSTNK